MSKPKKPERKPGSPEKRLAEGSAIPRRLEHAMREVRDRLETDVQAWIDDLTAVNAVLRGEINKGSKKRFSEAGERLERLKEALGHVPVLLQERFRQRAPELASADMEQKDKPGGYEEVNAVLAAVQAQLEQEIAERGRLEREWKEAERSLADVSERFQNAFGKAPIGMALIDMDGRWLHFNDALCRITGYSAEELKATSLRELSHPDERDLDEIYRQELIDGRIPNYQVEKRCRHAWGHYSWVLLTAALVRDVKGQALYLITQVQDISVRKDLAQRLENLVDHDLLTGLFNRRRFEQELEREVKRAARYGPTGAVLLIDLDNFKEVNDTFGHKAGDDLLKTIAGLLRQRLRHTDFIARVGGDEFALLLPQTGAEQAQIVADELVKALGRHTIALADQSISISASVGISLFDHLSEAEILACADLAMYEAKHAGRNCFAMYRPGKAGQEQRSGRLGEADRLRQAVEEDRLLLYCQPILDLKSNEVSQYELLLRLPGTNGGGPLPPSSFLYVAERVGLILAIDTWVVRKAVALIAKYASAGSQLVLTVNLSGRSIGDPKLAGLVEDTLAEARIDPAHLIFELKEAAAISNIEVARAFSNRVHLSGCQLALDDFGSGFGSFHYLKNFPFDYLKIDGEFIRGLGTSPVDQLIVQAIVGIARGMGKKTVAEFVGSAEEVHLIRMSGVDYAQGYHIGRPRPLEEVLPLTGAKPA